MVKDVVKSQPEMIDMWSYFQVVNTLENDSAGREKCIESREETHQSIYVVNLTPRDDKHVVRQ